MNAKYKFEKMPDGRLVATSLEKRPDKLFGALEYIKGELTEEKLATAKAKVIDDVCNHIREVAEDFFIIRNNDGVTSVGFKYAIYEDSQKN